MSLALFATWMMIRTSLAQATRPTLTWDRATLRHAADGGYARMVELSDASVLLSYESKGRSYVKRSEDQGLTWDEPVLAATYEFGSASNPHPLALKDKVVWLFYNERPRDGKHPFTIRLTISTDGGKTWTPRPEPLYVAGEKFVDGCWEPAAVQLATDDIWLFFANEGPYRTSDEQEITYMVCDGENGKWSKPSTASFRRGHRDGMPVPLELLDGALVVAIEDNGLTDDKQFKPAIVPIVDRRLAASPPKNQSGRRPAIDGAWPKGVYAGAPYLCRMNPFGVVLSCQSDEDGKPPQMTVYTGDMRAQHFGSKTKPFPTDPGKAGQWNSLFPMDHNTVTAISSTTVDGRSGVWLIDGHFK